MGFSPLEIMFPTSERSLSKIDINITILLSEGIIIKTKIRDIPFASG